MQSVGFSPPPDMILKSLGFASVEGDRDPIWIFSLLILSLGVLGDSDSESEEDNSSRRRGRKSRDREFLSPPQLRCVADLERIQGRGYGGRSDSTTYHQQSGWPSNNGAYSRKYTV